ncbi:MAG TPA: glycosyltransferase family 2 protein [Humisphaera sp.]
MRCGPPPLVSIVITVYRRTDFLRQAVRSALGQTYPNVEVVIAEDGGSDVAAAVVRELGDPRVRHRRCPVNVGEAGNRFGAYAEARGDFIANLDDDDLLAPQMIERLVAPLLADPRVVVAFGDHHVGSADGTPDPAQTAATARRFGRDRLAPGAHAGLARLCLVDASVPFACAAVFRRSVVDGVTDAAGAISVDDLYLAYLVCRAGGLAHYVPERLATYRIHGAQESAVGRERMARGALFCLDRCLADDRLAAVRPVLRRRWAGAASALAAEALCAGDAAAAATGYRRSLRASPTIRAAAGLALSWLPAGVGRRAVAGYRRGAAAVRSVVS